YSPWLQPVLAILLLSNLTSVWFRARTTSRMLPFYLVTSGALTLIASKAFAGPSAASFIGVFLTLVGSVWSTYSARSATIGSTRVARLAGMRQASNATT